MKNKIKITIWSICTLFAISVNIVNYMGVLNKTGNYIKAFNNSLNCGYIGTFIIFILIWKFYKWFLENNKMKSKVVNVLAGIFAFLMVFGLSYMTYGNASLVWGDFNKIILSIIRFFGYYVIFKVGISLLFSYLDSYKVKEWSNKFISLLKKHPFLISIIIIILCWLPYIISFYPIILSPDPSFQIKQFFGIRTKYADYAILLDENVVLTNHHPVVHTLLLGGCLKIGTLIGNDNLGLFIYSIIQIVILSCTLAYTIKYMMEHTGISSKFAIVTLLIYSLVPMFPLYAMSGVKDVIFTAFIILYILMLHKLLCKKVEKLKVIDCFKMIVLLLLVILFRNNGLYVIVLSFPFLILAVKKLWKPLLITFIITLICSTCYTKVILPTFKITPGSIREMLSIPFQQTARYVKYHEEDLSNEEIDIIDNILGYEDLASRYNSELSDPVKNEFNKYATTDDLKEYFKVWFKGLVKHPGTYINATVNNVYGFFYPEKTNWYVYYKYDTRITSDGFNYHYNKLNKMRNFLSGNAVNFPDIPVIGLISNIGFATWIVFILTGYVVYKRDYKKIILYLPALISILVCIAGPANTYFRYALPYIFSLPLMISFVVQEKKSYISKKDLV